VCAHVRGDVVQVESPVSSTHVLITVSAGPGGRLPRSTLRQRPR
jgi:hypothetical protein